MRECHKLSRLAIAIAVVSLSLLGTNANAQNAGKIKIGFVFFLSGAGAAFGTHARDGAKLMVDALNKGEVPPPYSSVGIAGRQIEAVFVDEAGGPQKQIAEYRRLVESEGVDMVIGYNSSADCNAIAPVAEELGRLTDFFYCGHSQLFEEVIPNAKYSFRTTSHGTMDQVAAARYLVAKMPNAKTIAGINQDYSWGQETWTEFKQVMAVLKPDVKVVTEKFPKLGAGEYGAEISSLLSTPADIVYTTFWGGDADAFALQAKGRGLGARSQIAMSMGAGVIDGLGENTPTGIVVGARGPYSYFAGNTPLAKWFAATYRQTYGRTPPFGAYGAAQGVLGMKAAFDKAAAGKPGLPKTEDVIAALRNSEFDSPSGFKVKMALANGHQAIQPTAYGTYTGWDKEKNLPIITDVKYYAAECVNPPAGVTSPEWIKSGLKGAKCD
jgi:branched-chain amino acid transport system substrate-binding protein